MRTKPLIRLRSATFSCCVSVVVVLQPASSGQGQIVTLTDQNSTVQVDPYSQRGLFQWSPVSPSSSNQRWFWYRIGGTGPQQSIDTIGAPLVRHYGTREATILYTANNFTLSLDFLLTGSVAPPPGQLPNSDLGQSITIMNTGATALDFHFFEYSHFNLSGSPSHDTVQLGRNLHGLFNVALQESSPWQGLDETITIAGANHCETAYGTATLDRLNTVGGYTLNDNAGPVGPGDVSYAFEWDFNIAPQGSALIGDDLYLISAPEPSAQVLLGCGLAVYAVRRLLIHHPRAP